MKNLLQKPLLSLAALLALGGGAGIAAIASAQTVAVADTASTTQTAAVSTTDTSTRPTFDPAKGGHVGTNGVKEVLLTGTQADTAKAAALTAVPGGTVERVETDAEGAAYEAHMSKADGSHVTVKFDSNFTVTGIETGPSGGPHQQGQ